MKESGFELKSFQVPLIALQTSTGIEENGNGKPPRHKNGEKFLKGPIPLDWLMTASQQKGKTLHLAIKLWFVAGMTRNRVVKLSLSKATDFGMKRSAASRALTALENAGLVQVIRRKGRSPVITLLDCPPQEGRKKHERTFA